MNGCAVDVAFEYDDIIDVAFDFDLLLLILLTLIVLVYLLVYAFPLVDTALSVQIRD
jgi:hypothetical protein